MKPREVVLNASPLICLSKSGLSGLLPGLFEHIVVPGAVVDELRTKGSADTEIEALLSQHWLQHIRDLSIHPVVASWDLGKGESEVLSYAFEQTGYWAILDDLAARRCAASIGCGYTGTVGIIVLAKKSGIVKSVRESLYRLQDAGLWLSKSFIQEVSESFDDVT